MVLVAACGESSSSPNTVSPNAVEFSVDGLNQYAGETFVAAIYAQGDAGRTEVVRRTATVSESGSGTVTLPVQLEPNSFSLSWFVDSNANGERDDGEAGWSIPLHSGDTVIRTSLATGEAAVQPPGEPMESLPSTCKQEGCAPHVPCPTPRECYMYQGQLICCLLSPY